MTDFYQKVLNNKNLVSPPLQNSKRAIIDFKTKFFVLNFLDIRRIFLYKVYVRGIMNTKLTLRLEETLIARAKLYAKKRGKSLSQLIAEYFKAIAQRGKSLEERRLGPKTQQLVGILKDRPLSEEDYRSYLEKKYS